MAATEKNIEPTTAGGNPGKKSKLRYLLIGGVVLAVIGVEAAAAWFFFASDSSAAPAVEPVPAAVEVAPEDLAPDPLAQLEDEAPKREVDLGEFSVTSYQPVSGTTLSISFHLFGTILASDESDFLMRFEANRHRVRDQVLVIVRGSDLADLTDAGLGLIKRKILEKTNRSLGKALLKDVVFSDFSFVEQ